MIELSRALARQFRAVMRRALAEQGLRTSSPVVFCQAGEDGLALETRLGEVAMRYHQADPRPRSRIAFLASLLAEVEGRTDAPVSLEVLPGGGGRASWSESGVPRVIEFELPKPERLPTLPELPTKLSPMPEEFPRVLSEAVRTTAQESTRFGTARVQLRGGAGEVIATDGRQLLIQRGFKFPWKDDVLVPRLSVFGVRDIPLSGPVEEGRTDEQVILRVGDWTFWLTIDKGARFPSVQDAIPRATRSSVLRVDPADAAFLATTLLKLPGRDVEFSPVTIDLSTPPAIRACSPQSGPATEVVLSRSTVSGTPLRVVTDRRYLLRAVQLGFTELQVVRPDDRAS